MLHGALQAAQQLGVDLLDRLIFEVVLTQQDAAADPGDGHDLQRTRFGLHMIEAGSAGHHDAGDGQCAEDIQAGGPGHGIGHIVVTGEQEDRDAGLVEAAQAQGKLALLGWAGITCLIGIAGKQKEIGVF